MKIRRIFWVVVVIGLLSCSKEDSTSIQESTSGPQQPVETEETTSGNKQLLGFRFTGIDNNGITVDIPGDINQAAKTIEVELPPGADVTALEPEVEISEKATYEPLGPQDFSRPINFTVTAEDGTSRTYLVTVTIALSQKEILLKIAEANPGKLDWKKVDNMGDWEEVHINGDGQVIELYLTAFGLASVPPEIGKLASLQKLFLGENELSSLPGEIGELLALKILILSDNLIETLPFAIGQLPALEELNLNANKLESLPPELGQLESLQILRLENNELSFLPKEIGQLAALQFLTLADNKLTILPKEFGLLVSLKVLDLKSNQLSVLPEEIGQLSNLTDINLRENQIEDLPSEIGNLGSLVFMSLSSNILNALPAEIVQLGSLEYLSVSENNLSALPPGLGRMPKLQFLFLRNNKLDVAGILPAFRTALSTSCSSSLTSLHLVNNEELRTLPECICEMDELYGGTTDIDIVSMTNSWAECDFGGGVGK